MGHLVNGIWMDEWYDTKKTGGRFVRHDAVFRHHIGSDAFPADANRYHLYVSHACPWAHRVLIFRELKDLSSIISVDTVHPIMAEHGWVLDEDSVNGMSYLHEIYTLADPTYTGRVTVPVLWDKATRTIVSNESSEIIRMFNTAFNHLTQNTRCFYPVAWRDDIDRMNAFVYNTINNGVYKVGFSTSQSVYNDEVTRLFEALDTLDNRLADHPYLVGDTLTEADIRLFTTLIRFDPVYVGHFKCNLQRIADYRHLSEYMARLYNMDAIRSTVNMDAIKTHYYVSHPTINPTKIVPVGPRDDMLSSRLTPHD